MSVDSFQVLSSVMDNTHAVGYETLARFFKTSDSSTLRVSPSSAFVDTKDRSWMLSAFPLLFPFARGGLSEKRPVPISMELYLRHLLRLSTRRFQEHRFLLVSYDVLSRSLTSQSAFVQANLECALWHLCPRIRHCDS